MMTLDQRIADAGITLKRLVNGGRKQTDDGWRHDDWHLQLSRVVAGQEYALAINMRLGTGNNGEPPSLGEALAAYVSTARDMDNTNGYEDWASWWATNPLEWPPRAVYDEQMRVHRELRAFLAGQDFAAWLYDTDASVYA